MDDKSRETPKISAAEFVLKYLRKNAWNGNKTALIFADDGTSRTYQEFYRDSVYVTSGLSKMRIKSGDRVSIVARNSQEMYPVILGLLMADALIIPSWDNPPASELTQNLERTKPNFVLASKIRMPVVTEAVNNPRLDPKPSVHDIAEFFKEAVSRGSETDLETFRVFKCDSETHAYVCIFSSGTTGPPKPVLKRDNFGSMKHTHTTSCHDYFEGPVIFGSQVFWGTWWNALLKALLYNRTLIFCDKTDTKSLLNGIHKYKPAIWTVVHPDKIVDALNLLEQYPGKWDISSLKVITTIAEVLSPTLHKELHEKLGIPIYHEYGSTEIGIPFAHDFSAPPVLGSVGKRQEVPILKLVDPESREEVKVPYQRGELLIHGVIADILDDPVATKTQFDGDGWYNTGDVLYFNEDGYYFVDGRTEQHFKYKTHEICPQEIEAYIRQVPGVAETAVVGQRAVDRATNGEVPTAFVVKKPNSEVTEQQIQDYVAEHVHDAKKLRGGVIFVDSLPRNANNKILRRKLTDMANNRE